MSTLPRNSTTRVFRKEPSGISIHGYRQTGSSRPEKVYTPEIDSTGGILYVRWMPGGGDGGGGQAGQWR
jgi:hypothetical protein